MLTRMKPKADEYLSLSQSAYRKKEVNVILYRI